MTFLGFLTGFVAVLCIGNYFRAKRAMERQRQRRISRLGGDGVTDSPRSHYSSSSTSQFSGSEQQRLLAGNASRQGSSGGEPRYINVFRGSQQINSRNRPPEETLIFQESQEKARVDVMSV